MNDSTVLSLAAAIENFSRNVDNKLDAQAATINEILGKHYTVNHEPKIELSFDDEYKYVRDAIDPIYSDVGGISKLSHVFISGYLPNGKTIRRDDGVYINGTAVISDYTCRAEEGSLEKVNLMIVNKSYINYSDFPITDCKMIIYDDVSDTRRPNIGSFLERNELKTIKCIGDFYWNWSFVSTLRELEVTGNFIIDTTAVLRLPCLERLIIPNSDIIPDILSGHDKSSLCYLDITKASGEIKDSLFINSMIRGKISSRCTRIGVKAFSYSMVDEIDTGDNCSSIGGGVKTNGDMGAFAHSNISKIRIGNSITRLDTMICYDCANLREVILDTIKGVELINFENSTAFVRCPNIQKVTFSKINRFDSGYFAGNINMKDLVFKVPVKCSMDFKQTSCLTEESCLNIINAINPSKGTTISVSLSVTVSENMKRSWYCKLENDKYVSCSSTDDNAITQETALILKGGVLT